MYGAHLKKEIGTYIDLQNLNLNPNEFSIFLDLLKRNGINENLVNNFDGCLNNGAVYDFNENILFSWIKCNNINDKMTRVREF